MLLSQLTMLLSQLTMFFVPTDQVIVPTTPGFNSLVLSAQQAVTLNHNLKNKNNFFTFSLLYFFCQFYFRFKGKTT